MDKVALKTEVLQNVEMNRVRKQSKANINPTVSFEVFRERE